MNKEGFIVPNDKIGNHDCPAALVKCVDHRFRTSDQEFVENGLGFQDFDLYCWPGAAKDVLKNNGFKTSLLEYIISISRGKHNIKKLILLWHWDCGGYGSSKNFSSADEEEATYIKDLNTVKDILSKELPDDLEIIMAYSKLVPPGLEYNTID